MDRDMLEKRCWEILKELVSNPAPQFPWEPLVSDFLEKHETDERPLEEILEKFRIFVRRWHKELIPMLVHWKKEIQSQHDNCMERVRRGMLTMDDPAYMDVLLAQEREFAEVVDPLPALPAEQAPEDKSQRNPWLDGLPELPQSSLEQEIASIEVRVTKRVAAEAVASVDVPGWGKCLRRADGSWLLPGAGNCGPGSDGARMCEAALAKKKEED